MWPTTVFGSSGGEWALPRGARAPRAHATHQCPDFMFPQMSDPELAPKDWEPNYFDYAYVALTNSSAFSPTDTMPMTRWAKLAVALQAVLALAVAALVVAREVKVRR